MRTSFTVVGSVIGAGFISGRELVRFFGGKAFLPVIFLTSLLFAGYLYVLLRAGRKYGSFNAFLESVFKKFARLVRGAFLVNSFIILTAMLAGINALAPDFSPYISALTAAACFFVARKGLDGVKILNMILVPVIIAYVFFSLFETGGFLFSENTQNAGMDILFGWLYVAMNMFLSAPVVMDCGGALARSRSALFSAALSAAIIGGCIALILSAIAATEGAAERTMPLLYVLKDGRFFMLVSFFGIVTTLISAYYPLHTAFDKVKYKDAARLFLLAAASVCAQWGLDRIVEVVYPALGACGILFLAAVVFDGKLFQQYHQKIHDARQRAKNNGRRHYEIKSEHLPAVDD